MKQIEKVSKFSLRVIEGESGQPKERPLGQIKIVKDLEKLKINEYQEKFFLPALGVLTGEKFLRQTIEATAQRRKKELETSYSSSFIAEIENQLVRRLINVQPQDREIIFNKYLEKLRSYASQHALPQLGHSHLPHFNGINNVVEYIRANDSESKNFFFESELDVNWKIDLIEIDSRRQGDTVEILEMNLVQIKSSANADDLSEIEEDHKRWLNERLMDYEEVLNFYNRSLGEIEIKTTDLSGLIENIAQKIENSQIIGEEDILKEVVQGPKTLSRYQKTALFDKIHPMLLNEVSQTKNIFDQTAYPSIYEAIQTVISISEKFRKEIINLLPVGQINSIIATPSKIFKNKLLEGQKPKTIRAA